MAFTYNAANMPGGDLTSVQVALWYARNRSGDTRATSSKARPDADWQMELEASAALSTVATFDTDSGEILVPVGTKVYRPFAAAANYIRVTPQHLLADTGTQLTDPREAADFLDQQQTRWDTVYGLQSLFSSYSNSQKLRRV